MAGAWKRVDEGIYEGIKDVYSQRKVTKTIRFRRV